MRHILALFLCAVIVDGNLRAQPEVANKFVSRSHSYNATTLPYRLFIPEGYSSDSLYPLILALHSAGERGSDNNLQLTATRLATTWADSIAQLKHPCFVVAPQCPLTGGWSSGNPASPVRPEMETVIDMLDSLAREFAIDTNRVYVTGFSMGGTGTWEIIMRFPERFAAAVPMSGGANPAEVYRCADVPVWNFHGAIDGLVSVMSSRVMIDSMRALGRSAVYTHCHNQDCSGLPDSTIAMKVASHEDLFYTEIDEAGHTYGIWGNLSNYPFLPDWLFDKYKKQTGSIALTNLQSYTSLSGDVTIQWNSSTGDSVEIWFSPDAGMSWQAVANVLNTGAYDWNSTLATDCAFGTIKVFLKTAEGFIIGSSRSSYFAVNNTTNGLPFVKLLNEEFTTGIVFAQDSIQLSFLAGDPAGVSLTASLEYSADGGSTFEEFSSFTTPTNPAVQLRRIGIGSLPNSNKAVIRLTVDNGSMASGATSFPFSKITPRQAGNAVTHTGGPSGATVTINIVDPSALTGHQYRVTFDDTSSAQKKYGVRDMNLGSAVVENATELDGVKEGPLFDGIRLVIADVTSPQVIADSTRWIAGSATLNPNVLVPAGAKPNFDDYSITLFSSVVDTSKSGFGPAAGPIKFLVWNLAKNRKTNVAFNNVNGDSTIGPDVTVHILEADSTQTLKLAWSLVFLWQPGTVSPVPGDQFVLSTVKPLSSSDVYELTGILSSVRPAAIPSAFSLQQNYPNPFNPVTTIRFTLARMMNVNLAVFDIIGRRVAVLVDGRMGEGNHEVRFDGQKLASGVYFYRLQAGGFVETKKLCLVR